MHGGIEIQGKKICLLGYKIRETEWNEEIEKKSKIPVQYHIHFLAFKYLEYTP